MKPYVNTDFALSEMFSVKERLKVRFRAEVANVLNHFNILTGRLNADPANANFGAISRLPRPVWTARRAW